MDAHTEAESCIWSGKAQMSIVRVSRLLIERQRNTETYTYIDNIY